MRWRLGGPSGRANLDEAITGVEVVAGFEQVPRVVITARDPDRTLIHHRLVADPGTFVDIDDVRHRLAAVAKSGSEVTLTFEHDAAIRLRDREGELTISAGSSATRFVRRLASDAGVPIARAEETGPPDDDDQQFARGEEEDSWAAIRRLADEVGWRAYLAPTGLMWVSDRHLASLRTPTRIREHTGGVDNIDFDFDPRKPADTMSLRIHDDGALQVGDPLEVTRLRPVNGVWLVAQTSRSPYRSATRVDLARVKR